MCGEISVYLQLNLDAPLLVDQVVDYSCATNGAGQYCAIAQFENIPDVRMCTVCVNESSHKHGLALMMMHACPIINV